MSDLIAIQGLILRKTPYSETSLICALLTRDRGQQHFLLKGARNPGKKKNFPAADLFRHVRIQYRPRPAGGLHPARDIELIAAYDHVAAVPNHFRMASWLSRFILRNTVEEDPAPRLFEALRSALIRLNGPRLPNLTPVWLGLAFTALDEHGLLPCLDAFPDQAQAMQYLFAYATDPELPPPDYNEETWLALARWTLDFLDRSQLHVPDGLENIT